MLGCGFTKKKNIMIRTSLFAAAMMLLCTSCQKSIETETAVDDVAVNSKNLQVRLASNGVMNRPNSWGDCELFAGVVTPATFKPESGNFDELYVNPGGYKDGVPLISDSKPGDRDYNGGRWHVNVLKESVMAGKYAMACAFEDLDPADFESTDMYFECPMLPRRGNR